MKRQNPAANGVLIQSMSCSSIVPDTQPQVQYPEARSLPKLTFKIKTVLWLAELPTYCPFNRTASRFLDRAVLTAEQGRLAR